MRILLVRHGHAGSKAAWVGDDEGRPLSERGREEAVALAGALEALRPVRIISSPLVRCLQTIEPLATRLGLQVEPSDRLVPDAGERAVTFVEELGDGPGPVVLCTHGEVIQEIQRTLRVAAGRGFGPNAGRAKASTWVLDYVDGSVTSAQYLPPPESGATTPGGSRKSS